jgi:hypothetical protein
MTRLYYSDPLAAAYMAKHFGMRFEFGERYVSERWSSELGADEQAIIESCLTTTDAYDPKHVDKYYIHPDSLHLLEVNPKSDLTLAGIANAMDAMPPVANRIIQRNGLAFMWPEQEVV